jgi:hypothetical protein
MVRPSRPLAYFYVVVSQWTRVALNPFQAIQWSTWIPQFYFLADVSLCEESPQVRVSHPYNINHNENHKSKGGKETHAKARVAATTRTQVKKRAHKYNATSSQLNKCSNLNHNDPGACLRSLGVLGCSMEAWCCAPWPRGPFYSPKAARSCWISIWYAILAFCPLVHRTVQCTTEHEQCTISFLLWRSPPLNPQSTWHTGHCLVHTGQSDAA